MSRIYVTTSIPYVNAHPHLGHALEFVRADVLSRYWRRVGHEVRLLAGTDDHAQKNVLAAEAAGVPTREYVDAMSTAFEQLGPLLDFSYDDFIRTSRDPRHRPGVERIWRACRDAGDLYRDTYRGLYCSGCEQFYSPGEVAGDICSEHDRPLEEVVEENWFFRLSRYSSRLREAIVSERLVIRPEGRRHEILALIDHGLEDFSISRPVERTRGWGIPVPDDPGQTIYVWWDALCNYITALDYGADGAAFHHWWGKADRRVHVIGKGILRFHAVYWPAMLLSAGVALPTELLVDDYLTVEGRKISKSLGNVIDPARLVGTYGVDAVRWWLLRAVPRVGDTDFRLSDFIQLMNEDLAGGIGNLVTRTVAMVEKYRAGVVPTATSTNVAADEAGRFAKHLEGFDFRSAAVVLLEAVTGCNREIAGARPWELAAAEASEASARKALDEVLGGLIRDERRLADTLAVLVPGLAHRAAAQLGGGGPRVGTRTPLFPRLSEPTQEV